MPGNGRGAGWEARAPAGRGVRNDHGQTVTRTEGGAAAKRRQKRDGRQHVRGGTGQRSRKRESLGAAARERPQCPPEQQPGQGRRCNNGKIGAERRREQQRDDSRARTDDRNNGNEDGNRGNDNGSSGDSRNDNGNSDSRNGNDGDDGDDGGTAPYPADKCRASYGVSARILPQARTQFRPAYPTHAAPPDPRPNRPAGIRRRKTRPPNRGPSRKQPVFYMPGAHKIREKPITARVLYVVKTMEQKRFGKLYQLDVTNIDY